MRSLRAISRLSGELLLRGVVWLHQSTNHPATAMSNEPPTDDRHRGLKPPQFGLATMFLAVTGLCGLLLVFRVIGPIGGTMMVLLLLVVLAHVAGSVLGRHLRADNHKRPSEP